MELTRRDAVLALAATGVGVGGGAYAYTSLQSQSDVDDPLESLVALAEVVYPTDVDVTEEFVETYVFERADDGTTEEMVEMVSTLESHTVESEGEAFSDLSVTDREDVLSELSVHFADANPEGAAAERIRHYLVDELLLALYSTPLGGELVGLENPPGYPGGIESYQEGP